MTWLDVGNGWRNLYLLSCLAQMGALGCLMAAHHFPSKQSPAACFLTGVACTPIVQYLFMLLMALVFPHAPKVAYIGVLPLAACVLVLVMAIRRVKTARERLCRLRDYAKAVLSFDKPTLVALCVTLCLALITLPSMVRFMSSMNSVSGGDAGEYMALAQRFCKDRSLAELLEKEETVGHFRGHSHFPSLELYMSYGLFHTRSTIGYPFDKPAFTGMGMLIFYAMAAYLALLCVFCGGRHRKAYILLGAVLMNLIPELFPSVAGAPRDIWRIVFTLFAALALLALNEKGGWKAYVGKALWMFVLCFTVMSAHVVSFVTLPFLVVAWVLWRGLDALLWGKCSAWKALLKAAGLALFGALGTLLGFSGNLWCFMRWGELSPWRLMTTFTDAPWYDMYMALEYKLEETTTHLCFKDAIDSLLMGYATPVGIWALRLCIAMLLVIALHFVIVKRKEKKLVRAVLTDTHGDGPSAVFVAHKRPFAQELSALGFLALMVLFTLAPMSGVLDSPLYSFSGSFAKLPRYTLQWFFLGNVLICASLSSLSSAIDRVGSVKIAHRECSVQGVGAWLCAVLCVLAFAKGTNQTGYTNTYYRDSRSVMENQTLLLDNGFREEYALLREVAASVDEEEQILITRVGYQYALDGRGYVLTSNPVVELMNLPLEQVESALRERNVALLATEPRFWDERYYPLSTLDQYLRTLPPEQIVETEHMRLYLLQERLVPIAEAALRGE